MKRSSIIALVVCGVILIYLGTIYISIANQSRPNFEEADATQFLNGLAKAFDSSSTEGVLAYAAPDAKVAGKDLDEARKLLHQAFRAMKEPHVQFANLNFKKPDEATAYLRFDAQVVDKNPSGYQGGGTAYSARMGFTVKRILMPKLWGLMKVYEWKVTEVDAPHLPSPENMLGF